VTVLAPDWSIRGSSVYAMPYLWQGMRYDGTVGLYRTNTRDVSPTLGGPIEPDYLGLVPDNNDYRWEGDHPTNALDPTGEDYVSVDYNTVSWVIQRQGFFNTDTRNVAIGQVSGDQVQLYPAFGGGTVSLSALNAFVNKYWKDYSDMSRSPEAAQNRLIMSALEKIQKGGTIQNSGATIDGYTKAALEGLDDGKAFMNDGIAKTFGSDAYENEAKYRARDYPQGVVDTSTNCGRLAANAMTLALLELGGEVLAAVEQGATEGQAAAQSLSCFPAGTLVHTTVGLKAIEQVAAGDQVWAYDHRQLCWAEREVVKVYQLLHQGTMATIQVQGVTLRATGGHPFWVVRGKDLAARPKPVRIAAYELGGRLEGRWVLARDLRAGDAVLLRPGEVVALESVRLDEVEERVYNFHVAELQNYAVGECGVLVHNTNDPPGLGNISHPEPISFGQATRAGQQFVGPGATEIAPGIWRSADGLRQFRMTNADVLGQHGNIGPHVHFESLNAAGVVTENLHVPVTFP
jgi:hypothetical protein